MNDHITANNNRILKNINATIIGTPVPKEELISAETYELQKSEGRCFYTKQQIKDLLSKSNAAITEASSDEKRDDIRKSITSDLLSINNVRVRREDGSIVGVYGDLEWIEKGKKANIGEIREWKGKKMQKNAENRRWVEAS